MAKVSTRSYSRYTQEALQLLGSLIRAGRKERGMTAQALAERAGISRGLLQRIEKGDPGCELGATLEAASIAGVRLFDADLDTLSHQVRETRARLALLPAAVRHKPGSVNDDF